MKISDTAQPANLTPTAERDKNADQTPTQVLEEAKRLTASGLSIIPVKADGSKRPAVAWKTYQSQMATHQELEGWFSKNGYGMGVVAGEVSGNLEVLDIDDNTLVKPWMELVYKTKSELLGRLVMVTTPNGVHVYYRCNDGVSGNRKLAQRLENGKPKTVIETRGEGGYVIAPGSPGECHPSGVRYEVKTGELIELPRFTGEEREVLLESAHAFNEFVEPKRVVGDSAESGQNRPGDDFNACANWEEILESHGWLKVGKRKEVTDWRRPGKSIGVSATTNIGNTDLFYNFSSNGHPFEAETAYSKFAAYTFLNHNEDFSAAAAQLASEGYGWPDPAELPPLLPIAPPLPPELIPEALRGYIEDEAEQMHVPLEMIAVPNLIALASVVGRQRGIKPKKRDDWLVTPNLWGAVVARPGEMKSPAQKKGLRQIEILVEEATQEYQDKLPEAIAEKQVYKLRIKGVKAEIEKAVRKNPDANVSALQSKLVELEAKRAAERLIERRYKTNDATVEKLGELLAENPNGLLLIQDELSGWIRSFDKPGREGDREFYLSSWNGDNSHTVDRILRGTIHNPYVCLSIVGGIQPGKLLKYVADALQGGWGDDGFLQRFQLLVYPEVSGDWTNVDRKPNLKARKKAMAVFRELACLANTGDEIPALHFDSEAQKFFNGWRVPFEKRLRSNDISCQSLLAHLDKYRSLMPTLALLFELADNHKAESVGLDATKRAALWCEFLEAHARKVYAGAIHPDLQAAYALVEKIKVGKIKDGTTVRDIYRNHWSFLTTTDIVKDGLAILEEYGWVRIQSVKTPGRSGDIVKLNPSVTFGT